MQDGEKRREGERSELVASQQGGTWMGPDAPFKAPRGSEPAEGVGAGGSVVKGGRDLSTREATKMDDLPEILSTRSLEKVTDQETGDLWNVPGLGRGEEELSEQWVERADAVSNWVSTHALPAARPLAARASAAAQQPARRAGPHPQQYDQTQTQHSTLEEHGYARGHTTARNRDTDSRGCTSQLGAAEVGGVNANVLRGALETLSVRPDQTKPGRVLREAKKAKFKAMDARRKVVLTSAPGPTRATLPVISMTR